jgi:hypothetical protein
MNYGTNPKSCFHINWPTTCTWKVPEERDQPFVTDDAKTITSLYCHWCKVMEFNATLKNISAISWLSVLLVEETGVSRRKPPTCHKPLTKFIAWCCIEYTSPWTWFELTTLVVINTDCTGNCKSNYHTITTAPIVRFSLRQNITNK